jgi:protein TonB
LAALALLLLVLSFTLFRNRDFWFGSDEVVETDSASSEEVAKEKDPVPAVKTGGAEVASPAIVKNDATPKPSTKPAGQKAIPQVTTNLDVPAVATKRVMLPPLDVEVVAGDTHRLIHSGDNLATTAISGGTDRSATVSTSNSAPSTNAAERERISQVAAPELQRTVDSSYPLLGQHSRVQGSVVLEAIVGADGAIEGLHVVSGPSILSAAAQQAVRQWRFKPVLQNGQPVETKARIIVNFSIRIADNPAAAS